MKHGAPCGGYASYYFVSWLDGDWKSRATHGKACLRRLKRGRRMPT